MQVKRLTNIQKIEVLDYIQSLNELSQENSNILGETVKYSLRYAKSGYTVVASFEEGTEDIGMLVRCKYCGGLRELFEGQIEFCLECFRDWE